MRNATATEPERGETPFSSPGSGLAEDVKSGVLLGWNGDGHTAYMRGSSCVDSAVDKYLVSLVVPQRHHVPIAGLRGQAPRAGRTPAGPPDR